MQSIYALHQSKTDSLEKEEKFLLNSIDNMYNLYLLLLSLLVEIRQHGEDQIVLSQKKYLATSEEKNPNRKFIDNKLLRALAANESLAEVQEERNIANWKLDDEYVVIIYQQILASSAYKEYMSLKETDFDTDRDFIVHIYKEIIATNEKLYEYLEDHKLTWLDDLPSVNTLLLKKLKKASETGAEGYFLPKLYKDEDDRDYAIQLLRKAVLNDEKFQQYIDGKTPNWVLNVSLSWNAIIIKMAICEFLKFASIPVKVTINEYLEIAKEYSTPKSSIFINGILVK